MREHDIVFVVFNAQAGGHEKGLPKHCGIRLHLQDSTVETGRFPRPQNPVYYNRYDFKNCTNGTNMAAQQCRESRYFHGIICCYIGFVFLLPRTNSRQATLLGAVPCKEAFGPALQHVVTLSWHAPRTNSDYRAASPKAVRQRTLFSCRERKKYISSQLQWIASESGNGTEKIRKYFRQDRESRRYWLNSVGDY